MPARLMLAIDALVRWETYAKIGPGLGALRVGPEFLISGDQTEVRSMACQLPVMLDLKMHDTPHAVARIVRSVLPLRPAMVTMHASGGAAMMKAACYTASGFGTGRPLMIAVTVLTSLAGGGAFLHPDVAVAGEVIRLATLAVASGADGVVCSPHEVEMLRVRFGPSLLILTPGIRPAGDDPDDQLRRATPRFAAQVGADWLVIGRPITAAPDPVAAALAILDDMADGAPPPPSP